MGLAGRKGLDGIDGLPGVDGQPGKPGKDYNGLTITQELEPKVLTCFFLILDIF